MIEKRNFEDEIADALLSRIKELDLKAGDKLPSHEQLAKELQVSVPSLRKGLQILVVLGAVRINHGSGTVVSNPSVKNYLRIFDTVVRTRPFSYKHILENLRLLMLPLLKEQMAAGTSLHSFSLLEEGMKNSYRLKDFKAFNAMIGKLFTSIASESANPILREFTELLANLLLSDPKVIKYFSMKAEQIYPEYLKLLEDIENRETEEALLVLEALLSFSIAKRDNIGLVYDTFGTGSIGGSFYSMGREICKVLRKYSNITIDTALTGGGIENVELTSEGKIMLGLTQSDIADAAIKGTGLFSGRNKNIRAICGIQELALWIIARKRSEFNSLKGLKGKRIAMGATGGETSIIADAVLNEYGYLEGDYRPYFLSISNAAYGLLNNEIDLIFFLSAGKPSAIAELEEKIDTKLLSIDSEKLDTLLINHPYWFRAQVDCNKREEKIRTVGVAAILITHVDAPESVVYGITSAIFEHSDDIQLEKKVALNSALQGVSVPLHPGARKYYIEKGAIKED